MRPLAEHPRLAVVALAMILASVWLLTVPAERDGIARVERADSTADWLVTHAATTGSDPYADIRELAELAGQPYIPAIAASPDVIVHPRLPGALVLMLPSQATTPSSWFAVMGILSALSAAAVLVWSNNEFGMPAYVSLFALLFFAVSAPALAALFFGTQSFLIAAAIVFAWIRLRTRDDAVAGVVVGAVLCLKVYPGLIIVGLLAARRIRGASAGALTFVALNGLGLVAFRINPLHALDSLGGAAERWIPFLGNGSLTVLLGRAGFSTSAAVILSWLIGLLLFLVLLRERPDVDQIVIAALAIGLLISPVSWEHYAVIGIPAAAAAWVRSRILVRSAIAGWFLVFILSEPVRQLTDDPRRAIGQITFVGGMILTVAAALAILLSSSPTGRLRSTMSVDMD